MENTTHLFLAVRFNCNKCHDHPFERWTQDQYYHLAAVFRPGRPQGRPDVRRPEDRRHRGRRGRAAGRGDLRLRQRRREARPHRQVVAARVSLRTNPSAASDGSPAATASRREQLARWITSKDNQYFAKSYVNRLWGYLFGVGIIEPIDDIRAGNPATNPELLDALTKDFIASGFDAQHMLRTICKSRTYQLSVATNKWNEDDGINYSHAVPRRLPAEVLYDAIHLATGSTGRLPGVPAGFRAAELPDAGVSDPFLEDFGKPARESSCECERSQRHGAGADPEAHQRPDRGQRPGRSGQRAEPARRHASPTTRS